MQCQLCNHNNADEDRWIVYKGDKRSVCSLCKSIYWQGIEVGRVQMSEKMKLTMKEYIEQNKESK